MIPYSPLTALCYVVFSIHDLRHDTLAVVLSEVLTCASLTLPSRLTSVWVALKWVAGWELVPRLSPRGEDE